MKVSLLSHNWGHPWVEGFGKAFTGRGHEYAVNQNGADMYLHGWSDGTTLPQPGAKNIFFCRNYEITTKGPEKIDWNSVDHLVCVNLVIAEHMKQRIGNACPVSVIYNVAYSGKWMFRERKPGKMIGMACNLHFKKNIPLAAQILAVLPDGYELHIVGANHDPFLPVYLDHFGKAVRKRIYLHDRVPSEYMDSWWEDKNFCLSTSLAEGCPNNVIEAMAKGIKPIVHAWPGAKGMFPDTFLTVSEAVRQIMHGEYDSNHYQEWVKTHFSESNNEKLVDLAEGVMNG